MPLRQGPVCTRALLLVALFATALAVAGGCGGDGEESPPSGALAQALSFLPASSAGVVVAPTDLDDGPLAELDDLGSKLERWDAVRRRSRSIVERAVGLDFETVIRPQLGRPLALAVGETGDATAAIRLEDPVVLRRAIDARIRAGRARRLQLDGAFAWRDRRARELRVAAIADGVLVGSRSREAVERALEARASGDNLAGNGALRGTLDRLGDDALVRLVGDARRLLEARDESDARELRRIPWIDALGTVTAVARVRDDEEVTVAFRIDSDRRRLAARDLPLPAGLAAPPLHDRTGPLSFAVRRPARLARFVVRVLGVLEPDTLSEYRSATEQLRSIFGVDLYEDFLDRVETLSVAVASGASLTFLARLENGASRGVARALARAAPVIEASISREFGRVTVDPRGAGSARVWEVRRGALTVARYAVRGDALVGAVGLADLPSTAPGRPLEGARGALAVRGDLERVAGLVGGAGGLALVADLLGGLGDVELSVRAEPAGVTGRGEVEVGDGG